MPLRAALYAVNSCNWLNDHWLSMLRRLAPVFVRLDACLRMYVRSSNAIAWTPCVLTSRLDA